MELCADGALRAVGTDDEVGEHASFHTVLVVFKVHTYAFALLAQIRQCMSVQVDGLALSVGRLGHVAVSALHAIEVGAQQVVRKIPGRHVLHHVLVVHHLALLVEVHPPLRRHR